MSVDLIMDAKSWVDVFPKDNNEARKKYRTLLRTVHPDVCPDSRANDAFIKLRRLYTSYRNGGVEEDTGTTTSSVKFTTVVTDDVFVLTRLEKRLFWLTRNRKDNDRAEQASKVLESLKKSRGAQFFPEFVSRFRDGTGRAGVEVKYPHRIWNLKDFNAFDERTVIWVFKRILVSLILAHEQGYIHGNISKSAIMLVPEDHGMVLDNWGYSVPKGQKLKIRSNAYIPEPYLKGEPADEWVDLAAAGDLALKLSNGKLNIRLKRFFSALMKYKETDAEQVLRDFNDVTEDIYGPPKFHPLAPPASEPII